MRLTEQNVKEVVIDASMQKAVFLYFYMNAPECEAATKALKAAISDDNEYISLVEADVQDQVSQAIAMQLGLQSVPALIVMKSGTPAEALQGDDIVSKLPETIKKYMPSESDLLIKEALAFEEKGAFADALIKAKQAYELDTNKLENKLIYARICIKTLAEQAADSPEIKELEQKYLQDPNNSETAIAYAAALSQSGKRAKALEILFALLKQDLSNEPVKKTFLDLLNTMQGDPLQKEYRRKLYTLMY